MRSSCEYQAQVQMHAQRNNPHGTLARFVHVSQKSKDFGRCITHKVIRFYFSVESLSEACVRACVQTHVTVRYFFLHCNKI